MRTHKNLRRLVLALAALLGVMASEPQPAAAQDQAARIARLGAAAAAALPLGKRQPDLSQADLDRYRRIFALQEEGRWAEADRLIGRLQDDLLQGHVLAQRYLHPTAYRSEYHELAAWLDAYADHPDAPRIHRLALRRKPAGVAAPAEPVAGFLNGSGQELRLGEGSAAARHNFEQGLAAWQSNAPVRAARYFTMAANDESAYPEERAAGAFWAARANIAAGRPNLAKPLLTLAAKVSDEFYGLLAQAKLGLPVRFEWDEAGLNSSTAMLLQRFPAARRAVALAQLGQDKRAEAEIRKLAARSRPELTRALAALAEANRLPGAQMRVAQRLRIQDGRRHDGALYPLPPWQPPSGFRVDRALLWAVARAESAFDVEARSHAGARGLMQIMPATASLVAQRHEIAFSGPADLDDPELNLEIGQTWLRRLGQTRTVGDSLIRLLAAYNAGEGRLQAWLAGPLGTVKDPLLFIERIPFAETRSYVKKVLGNLWVYRLRLGQSPASLQLLAEGRWPVIERQDETERRYAGSY
jgi:soluble lytic murein transglycosylase-like protein